MVTTGRERLVRVRDGWIAGVAGGVARRFGLPAAAVRAVWVLAVLLAGTGLLLYLVLWWLMPREDAVPVEPTVWVAGPDGSRRPPLARTTRDRKLLGVCGGIARRWGADPTLVRLGALALTAVSAGLAIVLYLLAALLMPSGAPQPAEPAVRSGPSGESTDSRSSL